MNKRILHILVVAQLVVVALGILFPIVWMVMSSLKSSADVTAYPPTFMFKPTLENYTHLLETTPFFA